MCGESSYMGCSEDVYRSGEDEVFGIDDDGDTGFAGNSLEEGCRGQLH